MSKVKKKLIFGLLLIVIIALILVVGGKLYMTNKENKNLENQRQAALTLKKEEPNVTKVVFTNEGASPGIGVPWTVEAKVTIDKEVFKMFLNKDEVMGPVFENDDKAKKYDEVTKEKPIIKKPLEVIYSNKKSEVFK